MQIPEVKELDTAALCSVQPEAPGRCYYRSDTTVIMEVGKNREVFFFFIKASRKVIFNRS